MSSTGVAALTMSSFENKVNEIELVLLSITLFIDFYYNFIIFEVISNNR